MNDEVQMVPLTALESQAQRDHQTMRYLALGWCITLALAVFSMLCMASYEVEAVETTEETSTVTQSAGDSASNYYAGRDYIGNADDQNDQEDD